MRLRISLATCTRDTWRGSREHEKEVVQPRAAELPPLELPIGLLDHRATEYRSRWRHRIGRSDDIAGHQQCRGPVRRTDRPQLQQDVVIDRKSTRLNSSHLVISYAVFCLKKKKKNHNPTTEAAIHVRHSLNKD